MRPWDTRENEIGNPAFRKLSRYIRTNSIACYDSMIYIMGEIRRTGPPDVGDPGKSGVGKLAHGFEKPIGFKR